METREKPPFSRLFRGGDIPPGGVRVSEQASKQERKDIAELLGLRSVNRFSFDAELTPAGKGAYDVTGSIAARVVQTCVITLEPIDVEIDYEVKVRFAPPEKGGPHDDPTQFDPQARDLEPLIGDIMDLGQLAYEHLAIAIDPYPRQAGTAFQWGGEAGSESDDDSPFAVLKRLKDG